MYTRMLIPLDGSKTAEAVLPYARTLARKLNLAVELLGVIDVPRWPLKFPAAAVAISTPSSLTAF